MEKTNQDYSLFFGGSREATVVMCEGKVIYQNDAVAALLGELPLSMVLSALDKGSEATTRSLNLYGHALVVAIQSEGELRILRIRPDEMPQLVHPVLVAELRNLLFSQQLTLRRLLDTLSEQDSDLYGSSVRRSYFGLLNYAERVGDMTQLASGGIVIFPQLMNLTQLYRDVVYALELVLPEKYPLPTLNADKPCYVNADPTRMEELLLYLLSNAIHHCSKENSIRIRLRNEKDTVRISVEDNGSGMDSDTVSRLFDPTDAPHFSAHLPLGLSLAKGIVQAHGGNLLIQSRSEEGTHVVISLPAVKNPSLPVAECIPPEGIRIVQRVLADILDLGAYREVFDD